MDKIEKTEQEWAEELNEEQFYVLRKKGTERAFTGIWLENKEAGTYACAGCGQPLFHSSAKYNSGSGWPSYFQPLAKEAVHLQSDTSHGMVRTEVSCARCGGHLGHLFDDGPQPTGQRYCVNAVSLQFKKQD